MRLDPSWRKAPLLLLRFRQVLGALLLGAAVLGVVAAARPAFLASSGRAALAERLELGHYGAGVRVTRFGELSGEVTLPGGEQVTTAELVARVSRALGRLIAPIDDLGRPTVTRAGQELLLRAGERAAPGRLIHKTGALAEVEILSAHGSSGLWLSDQTAAALGAGPGDEVVLESGGRRATAPVAGIYRHLALDEAREFWSPEWDLIYRARPSEESLPPALVIVDDAALFDALARSLADSGRIEWNVPVRGGPLSLQEAGALERAERRLIDEHLSASGPIARLLAAGTGTYQANTRYRTSGMTQVLAGARTRVAAVRAPVDVTTIAALAVALSVMTAAGYYLVQSRRTEFVLLAARGSSPAVLAARAVVESALPAALGTAAGALAGVVALGLVGPGGGVPLEALAPATALAAAALAAGLLAEGAAVLLAVRRAEASLGGGSRSARRLPPWEVAAGAAGALALAAALGGRARFGTVGQSDIRLGVLLGPAGAALGLSACTAWGLRLALPGAARLSERAPAAVYLAAKRLAGAPRAAGALVAAAAFSLAVLAYAATLAGSTEETTRAKAYVHTGSDASVSVAAPFTPPELEVPSTHVVLVERAAVLPGEHGVALMGIDPATFESTAYWDERFSDRPLRALLDALERSGARFPAIAVGQAPGSALLLRSGEVPVTVVGAARAFPGQRDTGPLLVTTKAALQDALERGLAASGRTDHLWLRGSERVVAGALAQEGVRYYALRTVGQTLSSPSLGALLWSLGLLQGLGAAAGLISLVGLVLYRHARAKSTVLARALTARMGLGPGSYFVMLLIENALLLGAALVAGFAGGTAVAALVRDRFDLLPEVPPPPLLELPVPILAAAGAVVATAALASALATRRATERADVAAAMRVA